MKFFVPDTTNEDEAKAQYQKIKDATPWPIIDRRIQKIGFRDRGKSVEAEVGRVDPIEGGTIVMAIFQTTHTPALFLVCTKSRGGRFAAEQVGEHEGVDVTDFDAD